MRYLWIKFPCLLLACMPILQAHAACSLIPNSQSCIDATPCKQDTSGTTICLAGATLPAGALSVPHTCWQYSYQFACTNSSTSVDTCSTYRNNQSCAVTHSSCVDTVAETGQCDSWSYTYQCQTTPATTSQQVSCTSGGLFNSIVPTPNNSNNNLATAAIAQEVLREAQVYNQNGNNLFSGVSESCTKGYYGLHNCCGASPGAKSNAMVSNMLLGNAASVVKYAGEQAIDWASPYVFDFMYNNDIFSSAVSSEFATSGYCSATGSTTTAMGTNFAANGLTLSAWGFTFSSAGTLTSGTGFLGGNIASSTGYFAFNPYVFAAQIVLTYAVQQLTSCTTEEQMLAMHKGADLSSYMSETCSNKVLNSCVEYTDSYCSFNSVLAKIINIQGKTQLGLPISDCKGITPQQLSTIDFTKLDLSEFTHQAVTNAISNMPSSTSINSAYGPTLQNSSQGSSQTKSSTVLPSY